MSVSKAILPTSNFPTKRNEPELPALRSSSSKVTPQTFSGRSIFLRRLSSGSAGAQTASRLTESSERTRRMSLAVSGFLLLGTCTLGCWTTWFSTSLKLQQDWKNSISRYKGMPRKPTHGAPVRNEFWSRFIIFGAQPRDHRQPTWSRRIQLRMNRRRKIDARRPPRCDRTATFARGPSRSRNDHSKHWQAFWP